MLKWCTPTKQCPPLSKLYTPMHGTQYVHSHAQWNMFLLRCSLLDWFTDDSFITHRCQCYTLIIETIKVDCLVMITVTFSKLQPHFVLEVWTTLHFCRLTLRVHRCVLSSPLWVLYAHVTRCLYTPVVMEINNCTFALIQFINTTESIWLTRNSRHVGSVHVF